MARSYNKTYIETRSGLNNVFAHKIFCGWDYSIATNKAANLKMSAIYNELKVKTESHNFLKTLVFNFRNNWMKFILAVLNFRSSTNFTPGCSNYLHIWLFFQWSEQRGIWCGYFCICTGRTWYLRKSRVSRH